MDSNPTTIRPGIDDEAIQKMEAALAHRRKQLDDALNPLKHRIEGSSSNGNLAR